MPGFLDIIITECTDDSLTATMPVVDKTRQPFGILHGGASVVLAETVGSIAANLVVDANKFRCVGQEINANHIRPTSSGLVTATAKPIHLGRGSQVWDIRIMNEQNKLACISRLTMAVIKSNG